jgi:hypothetical protein
MLEKYEISTSNVTKRGLKAVKCLRLNKDVTILQADSDNWPGVDA